MTNLDTTPSEIRVPTPSLQLVAGPTTWFHVPISRSSDLGSIPHAHTDGSAVNILLQWLLHQGALYTFELRLCGSGQHGGIWLGLTGHGATPRHAAEVARDGRERVESFLRLNRWRATVRKAPRLPRWSAGLCFRQSSKRMSSKHGLVAQRALVQHLAAPGSPLVMQLRMQAPAVSTEVYDHTRALERRMRNARFVGFPSHVLDHHQSMIQKLKDDAADLTVTVHLSSARVPSALRLRQLASAFPGSRIAQPWAEQPSPTRASLTVLRDGLALLAGREAP